jgi:hypothetical protein
MVEIDCIYKGETHITITSYYDGFVGKKILCYYGKGAETYLVMNDRRSHRWESRGGSSLSVPLMNAAALLNVCLHKQVKFSSSTFMLLS